MNLRIRRYEPTDRNRDNRLWWCRARRGKAQGYLNQHGLCQTAARQRGHEGQDTRFLLGSAFIAAA